jgi:hypothetical protein
MGRITPTPERTMTPAVGSIHSALDLEPPIRERALRGQVTAGRDRIPLVAGDGDYEPMVRQLLQDSFEVTLLY